MRILAVGDVVGERAVRELGRKLHAISNKYAPELIIVNGENAAGGRGLTPPLAADIFAAGADIISSTNPPYSIILTPQTVCCGPPTFRWKRPAWAALS